jgi:hypothetical protein
MAKYSEHRGICSVPSRHPGTRGSFEVSSITANRVWSFPDQAGTVALLSDIPVVVTPTLQSVTTAGNTTTLDIYANSFYTNTRLCVNG